MTRKYAAVPLDLPAGECDGGEPVTFGWVFEREGIGKITAAQIDAMAQARFDSKQAHIKEFSGWDGPTWAALDPDTLALERADMIVAVKAAGFEVE
ncbi:hypothetical protein [Thalassospira lohafexi]|uniref:Uncharacterized protein n=1 Tax=Thalassospira lohafexi TaxID=744227 RepID=A0A2N3L436_9PROT|nr:hypothetical protein [Thalassospira lohafexi]PKR57467.1 hypothetical protein COO92_16125 [Thalassospira lohafexi]